MTELWNSLPSGAKVVGLRLAATIAFGVFYWFTCS